MNAAVRAVEIPLRMMNLNILTLQNGLQAIFLTPKNSGHTCRCRLSSCRRVFQQSVSRNKDLQAGGAVDCYAVYDQRSSRNDIFSTRVQTESQLVSSSGGDTLLQGTQVRAAGGFAFNAGLGEKARADARITRNAW